MKNRIGDIILFKTKLSLNPLTWIALGIRIFTKYKYNHVGVVVENWGQQFLYEMTEKGLEVTELQKRLKGETIQTLRKSGLNQKEFSLKVGSLKHLKGYDFVSLFLYQPIFQLTRIWIGRKNEKAERLMYCSEYAAYLHNLSEFWKYSPNMLEASKKFIIIK